VTGQKLTPYQLAERSISVWGRGNEKTSVTPLGGTGGWEERAVRLNAVVTD